MSQYAAWVTLLLLHEDPWGSLFLCSHSHSGQPTFGARSEPTLYSSYKKPP